MVPKITNDGLGLQVLALDGEGLNFSKIVMGNGEAPLDYRVLKDLVNPLEELNIDDLDIEDTEAVITATFSNANTDDSFDWTEVGIFCTNPASTQQEPLDDILYAYGHCRLDDENIDDAAHIPAHGSEVFEILLKYRIFIGDLDDVTATIIDSQNYATKLELNQHIAEVNPHNLTAEDIGLGNVENKAFLDNNIGFQISGATSGQISPGMNIKVFFQKVYMAIENLTSHIANTLSHVSSSDRTAWNNKSDKGHKHSANDVTSGTLSIARGGTGGDTAATARTNLSVYSKQEVAHYVGNKLTYVILPDPIKCSDMAGAYGVYTSYKDNYKIIYVKTSGALAAAGPYLKIDCVLGCLYTRNGQTARANDSDETFDLNS